MASRYGHTWVSQFGASPAGFAGAEWSGTLSGITRSQIVSGMATDAARGAEFPPSSPRFRAMCLGIPEFGSVRRELTSRNSASRAASPFAVLVWQHLDTYRWKQSPADHADRLLREAYEAAHEHVMRGGALPDAPVAELSHAKEERKPADPETAKAEIERMAQMLGVAHPEAET